MKPTIIHIFLLVVLLSLAGCSSTKPVKLVRNVYLSPTGEVLGVTGDSPIGLTRRFYVQPDGSAVPVTRNYYGDYYYNWGCFNVVDWYPTPSDNVNYNYDPHCPAQPCIPNGDHH
jgi:hypothetical protein